MSYIKVEHTSISSSSSLAGPESTSFSAPHRSVIYGYACSVYAYAPYRKRKFLAENTGVYLRAYAYTMSKKFPYTPYTSIRVYAVYAVYGSSVSYMGPADPVYARNYTRVCVYVGNFTRVSVYATRGALTSLSMNVPVLGDSPGARSGMEFVRGIINKEMGNMCGIWIEDGP
ncbi:uncharacterized protein FOMMEDRAFT_158534 [Fomitiporia mediterranea MF3/22]|uniref:uncharacterized protein n=1 Tax=Fomitiporia mediterranea (strain MF3/22) TaxID=694068 RepID=UPI0004408933|nr:uncharacterized protein FOMMEDRAFT_158534 [Fomitiporia mediterranea MF3/22]EJD01393.1 hypothetical protein FOMMEDRAFT_158534 [Fomitiporia mediterranea MF3/22]